MTKTKRVSGSFSIVFCSHSKTSKACSLLFECHRKQIMFGFFYTSFSNRSRASFIPESTLCENFRTLIWIKKKYKDSRPKTLTKIWQFPKKSFMAIVTTYNSSYQPSRQMCLKGIYFIFLNSNFPHFCFAHCWFWNPNIMRFSYIYYAKCHGCKYKGLRQVLNLQLV